MWVKSAQTQLEQEPKYPKLKTQFNIFNDEYNLLRCKGRLKKSILPYATRFTFLLPQTYRLTILLIRKAHENNGVRDTLTELRAKYWVIKGRKTVQTVVKVSYVAN